MGDLAATDLGALIEVLRDIGKLREQSESLTPAPHSVMWADDAKTEPWPTSHGVFNALACAFDNMGALESELVQGRVVRLFAPWTLFRAAIENGCFVIWLLSPSSRPVRVRRRLVSMWAEHQDVDEIRSITGEESVLKQRLQQVRAAAVGAGVAPDSACGAMPSWRTIVDEAGAEVGLERVAGLLWRTWSGLAHGRQSQALLVMETTVLPVIEGHDSHPVVRVEPHTDLMLSSATVVELLLRRALHLAQMRCTNLLT